MSFLPFVRSAAVTTHGAEGNGGGEGWEQVPKCSLRPEYVRRIRSPVIFLLPCT